jgi:hypothetical protein
VAISGDSRRKSAVPRGHLSYSAKRTFLSKGRDRGAETGTEKSGEIADPAAFSTFPQLSSTSPARSAANLFSSLIRQKGVLVRDRGGGGGLPLPPSSPRGRRESKKFLSIPELTPAQRARFHERKRIESGAKAEWLNAR